MSGPAHIAIRKTHVFDLQMAFYMLQFLCARCILYLRLGSHDLQKALKSGHPGNILFHKIDQLADGCQKCGNIQTESHQVNVIHRFLHDKITASQDDQY